MSVRERQAHPQTSFGSSQEIDLDLLTFVERYATNLIRWDVLLYFGQNPDQPDNVDEIAQSIGRVPVSVQKELDDLAYLGVLKVHPNGQGKRYGLTRAPRLRRSVLRFARRFQSPASQT